MTNEIRMDIRSGPLSDFDIDVFTNMQRFYEDMPDGRGMISFTDYGLLKQMGIPESDKIYRRLHIAKEQIAGMRICVGGYSLGFFNSAYITNRIDELPDQCNSFEVSNALKDYFRSGTAHKILSGWKSQDAKVASDMKKLAHDEIMKLVAALKAQGAK